MHKRRVKVTLNDEASEAIRRLSLASGDSMSGVIASLFDPHVSELNHIADLLEKAAKVREELPNAARDIFRQVLAGISEKSEPDNETTQASMVDHERQKIIASTMQVIASHEAKKQATATNSNDNRMVGEPPALEPWEIEEMESEGYGLLRASYD